jgi:hypothetical protein
MAGTRGHLQIGDVNSSGGGLVIWDNQGALTVDYWKNGAVSNTEGVTLMTASSILAGNNYLLTVSWGDSSTGIKVYLNSVLVYKVTGLVDFSTLGKNSWDSRYQVFLGRAGLLQSDTIVDDFAIFSLQQTQQKIDDKVALIGTPTSGNPLVATTGTAQILPFWLRQNPPNTVASSAQNKAFSMLVTGDSL